MEYKIGETVTWCSSSNGSMTQKTGEIVDIVRPGNFPRRHGLDAPGMARDHESYIVAVKVGKTDKAKPKLYWPRVSMLQPAQ